MRRSSCPTTGCAPCRGCTSSSPMSFGSTAWISRYGISRPSPTRGLFGGNSNWRGPDLVSGQFSLIESLQKFHHYYGDDFKVECPTGSGRFLTLEGVAKELARRLTRSFLRDAAGRRPVFGSAPCCNTIRISATTSFLRILSRRYTARCRRLPSDRLDRPGRQAADAALRPGAGAPRLPPDSAPAQSNTAVTRLRSTP